MTSTVMVHRRQMKSKNIDVEVRKSHYDSANTVIMAVADMVDTGRVDEDCVRIHDMFANRYQTDRYRQCYYHCRRLTNVIVHAVAVIVVVDDDDLI